LISGLRSGVAGSLVGLGLLSAPLRAQMRVAEWGGGELDLTGYVRALTAVQESALRAPGFERTSAFAGQVSRLKWTARGAEGSWVLEVHNRLQGQISSADALGDGNGDALGDGPGSDGPSVVGFGVSAVPDRSLDLETTLVEEDGLRVWHDVDRLALTLYGEGADVTIGRQAITWGLSSLFPVADLWAQFSPFELDTEEKPGIDAVRVLAYPGEGLEVDAVLADRGSLDDLSVGARATWTLDSGDLYLGAGKFWRQAIALAGATWLLEEVKLRAEAAFPWEIEDVDGDGDDGVDRPRVTVGADWIRGDWLVSGELHLNGVGADDEAGYAELLATDPRLARGESYYLGRWLAGALASWSATDRFSIRATALVNLQDPSASFTPIAVYDLGQNARISVGGLISTGSAPRLVPLDSGGPGGPGDPPPVLDLRSEFGSYGELVWTRVSLYF